MTVSDLKQMLAKLPPDCDDLHVMLSSYFQGQKTVDLLSGLGYYPVGDNIAIALVGISEIQRMVQSGEMQPPTGYDQLPPLPGDEWKQG